MSRSSPEGGAAKSEIGERWTAGCERQAKDDGREADDPVLSAATYAAGAKGGRNFDSGRSYRIRRLNQSRAAVDEGRREPFFSGEWLRRTPDQGREDTFAHRRRALARACDAQALESARRIPGSVA
jgi:hypothetical protein